MKIKYFSWVRERIGIDEEVVDLPDTVETLGDLMAWQVTRGEGYKLALSDTDIIRIAVDMKHVTDMSTKLQGRSEIALFPPMTGG